MSGKESAALLAFPYKASTAVWNGCQPRQSTQTGSRPSGLVLAAPRAHLDAQTGLVGSNGMEWVDKRPAPGDPPQESRHWEWHSVINILRGATRGAAKRGGAVALGARHVLLGARVGARTI